MKVEEAEWLDNETRWLDRYLPRKHHGLALRLVILSLILFVLALKFFKIFIVVILLLVTSYIRFKREKKGIPIEIEPTYLLTIVVFLAYGFRMAVLFIALPLLLTSITRGFGIWMMFNFMNKFLVLLGVMVFLRFSKDLTLLVFISTGLVLAADLLTSRARQKMGQPFYEIIVNVSTNFVLRLVYFSLFLEPAVILLTSVA